MEKIRGVTAAFVVAAGLIAFGLGGCANEASEDPVVTQSPDREALERQEAIEEVEIVLKNAATAMESFGVEHASYAGATYVDLLKQGFRSVKGIVLSIHARGLDYCLEAEHNSDPKTLRNYESDSGEVRSGRCPMSMY